MWSVSFGHLGCARENRPYVVPLRHAYVGGSLYFITIEVMKADYIEENREVCFQVEGVRDAAHRRSVMVTGRANDVAVYRLRAGVIDGRQTGDS